ncbi:MAG: tetratricopeptide repeat protein, partial [Candidatus Hydrogenedentota bacterium]
LKGNCYLKKKDYPAAEKLFESVITTFPDMPYAQQARYKLAISLMEHGATTEAKTHLETLTRQSGKIALVGDASFLLGTLLMDRAEFSNAGLQFLRVVEQYPQSEFAVDSYYKLGECYALSGQLSKSAETFESFARSHKDSPLALEAVFHSADAYFQLGRFQDALIRFQHVASDGQTSAFREEALYRVAIAYHNLNKTEESISTFSKVLEKFPESKYAAESQYRIGDYLLFEKNSPVEAMEHFTAVARTMPTNAFSGRAYKGIAVAHYEMKDFDGAVEEFYRVIMQYPEVSLQPSTYEWVGQHLFDRGEWRHCKEVFTALLDRVKNYPQPEQVHLKLGDALASLEDYDGALAQYAWIGENRADTGVAHEASYRTAQVLEKQDKREDAVALYETVASATMNDTAARARFRLGELFESGEEYNLAAKHYMRVAILFLHPELSQESLWRAGQCYEKGENVSSALKIYRDIVEEYPDTEQASQATTRLTALKG